MVYLNLPTELVATQTLLWGLTTKINPAIAIVLLLIITEQALFL